MIIVVSCIFLSLAGYFIYQISRHNRIPNPTKPKEDVSEIKFDKIEDANDNTVLGILNNKRVVANSSGSFVDENINDNNVILKENGFYIVIAEKTILKRNGVALYELPEMELTSSCQIDIYNDDYILITYLDGVQGRENGENDLIRNKNLVAQNIDKFTIYQDKKDVKASKFWYYGTKEHPTHYTENNNFYYLNKETIEKYDMIDTVTTEENQKYYLLLKGAEKYIYQTSNNRLYQVDSQVDYLIGTGENKVIETNHKNYLLIGNIEKNKIGVLDAAGNVKQDFLYETAHIKDNYILFTSANKYGLANLENKVLLPPEYDRIEVYGKYIVTIQEKKIKIRNENMEEISDTTIELTNPYSNLTDQQKQALLQGKAVGEYLHLQYQEENLKNLIVGKQGIITELDADNMVSNINKEVIITKIKEKEGKIEIQFSNLQAQELLTITVEEGNQVEISKAAEKSSTYQIKIYQDNTLIKVTNYEIKSNIKNIVYNSKEYVNEITSGPKTWKYMLKNNILKMYEVQSSNSILVKNVISIEKLNEEYGIIEISDHKWKLIKLS